MEDAPICEECGGEVVSVHGGMDDMYQCDQCYKIWHQCSEAARCYNMFMVMIGGEPRSACQRCYLQSNYKVFDEYRDAEAKLTRVAGTRCPGCGSMDSHATMQGRQCNKCTLYWHLCPEKKGMIRFNQGREPICSDCTHDTIMEDEERKAERAARFGMDKSAKDLPKVKLRCTDCDSFDVSRCGCEYDCHHGYCNQCSMFMHFCPNVKDKTIAVFRPNGDKRHIRCEDCRRTPWGRALAETPAEPAKPAKKSVKPAKKSVADKELLGWEEHEEPEEPAEEDPFEADPPPRPLYVYGKKKPAAAKP